MKQSIPYEDLREFIAVLEEHGKLFRVKRPINKDTELHPLVRGQYSGYRAEKGVAPGSKVETFAAVRLHIDSWRWDGVLVFIRAGKCLPTTTTEVLVKLKKPPLSQLSLGETNYLRFRLSPDVTIAIGAREAARRHDGLPANGARGRRAPTRRGNGCVRAPARRRHGRRCDPVCPPGCSGGGVADRRSHPRDAVPAARVRGWHMGSGRRGAARG